MAALAIVSRAAVVGLSLMAGGAFAAEGEARPVSSRLVCLNAADTRDQVKAHKLLEPYAALKSAAQQRKAEALSAKLCVNGDDFVYVITLLHRDGRLIRVQMDAGTGKLIPRPAREPKDAHDQPAKD